MRDLTYPLQGKESESPHLSLSLPPHSDIQPGLDHQHPVLSPFIKSYDQRVIHQLSIESSLNREKCGGLRHGTIANLYSLQRLSPRPGGSHISPPTSGKETPSPSLTTQTLTADYLSFSLFKNLTFTWSAEQYPLPSSNQSRNILTTPARSWPI